MLWMVQSLFLWMDACTVIPNLPLSPFVTDYQCVGSGLNFDLGMLNVSSGSESFSTMSTGQY